MRINTFIVFALTIACFMPSASVVAQEIAQKGRDPSQIEMKNQIRSSNAESFDAKATETLTRGRKAPLLTPMQSTNAFLALDRNHDMYLTRSELPQNATLLRMQFDKYDLNHDHRLSYSEFANYTDVVPYQMADSSK